MRASPSTIRAAGRQILIGAALLFVAPTASATPNFPGIIKRQLELSYEPECATCHAGGNTGKNTVNTPFGVTVRSRGLVGYDEASLVLALTAISAEKKDSDGDGVTDIDELKAGTDPNAGAGGGEEDPEYGCSFAPARASSAARVTSFALALLMGLLIIGRRAWSALGRCGGL